MIDVNTDLTRGRLFAGKSYVNPQTRSASLGGYYGYYHSIRSGSPRVTWRDASWHASKGVELSLFLDSVSARDRAYSHYVAGDRFKDALFSACRVYNRSVMGYSRYEPALPVFLKHAGNRFKCICDDTDDTTLATFLYGNKPVKDSEKYFILRGSLFFELESGNMETPSGKLAYDSYYEGPNASAPFGSLERVSRILSQTVAEAMREISERDPLPIEIMERDWVLRNSVLGSATL